MARGYHFTYISHTKQLQFYLLHICSCSRLEYSNILANAKDKGSVVAAAAAGGVDASAGSAASAAVPLVHWGCLCPRHDIAVLQDHEHGLVIEVADVEVATNHCWGPSVWCPVVAVAA